MNASIKARENVSNLKLATQNPLFEASVMQAPNKKPTNNSAYIDGPCSAHVGGVSPSSKAYTSDRSRRMVATGYSLNRAQPYTSCTSPTVGGLQTREHEKTRSD